VASGSDHSYAGARVEYDAERAMVDARWRQRRVRDRVYGVSDVRFRPRRDGLDDVRSVLRGDHGANFFPNRFQSHAAQTYRLSNTFGTEHAAL